MATMKAVRLHEFGGPQMLKYEEAPKPEPKDGEVLIKVAAAGINPIDAIIEAGAMEQMLKHTLPLIPGWDMAGTVEAFGPGVTGFTAGDAVFAFADGRRDGAYAEYAVIAAESLCPKPTSIDFPAAASIPMAGTTAWQALFVEVDLQNGQTILIHGAGGSVGAFAVQFAKVKGATVIATATGDDIEYVRGLGADVVVDYKTEKFEDAAHGVDAVLDIIGGETQARSWVTLRNGGLLVSIRQGVAVPPEAAARGIEAKFFGARPNGLQLKEMGSLVDAGKDKTRVGQTFPLSEAEQAQEQVKRGHTRGKIVLTI